MRQINRLLLLFLPATLIACETAEPPAQQSPDIAAVRQSRDVSVSMGNYGRGGAAMRQPAYVHTLGGSVAAPLPVSLTPEVLFHRSSGIALSLENPRAEAPRSYSLYEMQHWERYCASGKGMDSRDWAFIKKEGANNIPSPLVKNCIPPR